MTAIDDDGSTIVLNPRTRVRRETVRQFLKGLKALLEQGCQINAVHFSNAVHADKQQRATTIGQRRTSRMADAPVRLREKGKPGRKRVHRQRKEESQEDYTRRLARNRQAKARARKKGQTK